MTEFVLPPSPSWYLSKIIASSDDGKIIAYGARHELVVYSLPDDYLEKPTSLVPNFITMAHKDKITAVALPPTGAKDHKDCVVTSSDDGFVRVWNYDLLKLIYSHSGHTDGQKVVCVDWSTAVADLIVSISDLGCVICWDLTSNTIRRLLVAGKVLPVSLACNPHNKDVVAIGAKGGLVVIYNVKGDGSITFRLRGHESDVISLAYCPVPYNIFREENSSKNTHLLVTGAKDQTIYFWRSGTDGRFETFVNLPKHPMSGQKNRNGLMPVGGSWVCVRWPDKHTILSSSLFGELLRYDLKSLIMKEGETLKKKCKVHLIHSGHNKGLFSIGAAKLPSLVGGNREFVAWTTALDKQIICSSVMKPTVHYNISSLGGIVYCMAVSPHDPNRIAIGSGDNRISIWNMTSPPNIPMSSFWNKINSKVMSICWHPVKENLLAFGTGEGRVGLLDVSSGRVTILRLYHRKCVYNLIWAPKLIKGDDEDNLALFSVGDGDILQYNPNRPEQDPITLNNLLKNCDAECGITKSLVRTDLAWNHDRSLAAIGNENGCLYIVDGASFKYVHSIFAHKKLVQCAIWHPATVTSESSLSPYVNWLATASDNIQIFDISNDSVTTIQTFNDHSERVVSLMWSPHINGLLATASYDYTSQVWDVIKGTLVSKFDGHHAAVVSCMFSPVHPDKVISGGFDCTLRLWNIPAFSDKTTLSSKSKKQRMSSFMKKFEGSAEASIISSYETLDSAQGKGDTAEPVKQLEVRRKPKSMFSVVASSLSQPRHLPYLWARLQGETQDQPPATNSAYLDFFGDESDMKRLLMVEESNHLSCGSIQNASHASLWMGEISQVIKEATKKKQLNDWLVSLAPHVSHRVWVESCCQYAKQLAESGDGLKAASYLLAVHKVEEAVDTLIESKLPREAVSLAKARFPPDNPIAVKALTNWGQHCAQNGQLVLAAHCMLSVGNTAEAVEILSRTADPDLLSVASKIAAKCDSKDQSLALALRSVSQALVKADYTSALSTISIFPEIKALSLWVKVCEAVHGAREESSGGLPWVLGNTDPQPSLLQSCLDLCQDYLAHASHDKPTYLQFAKLVPLNFDHASDEKVWLYICGQLTLFAVAYNEEPKSLAVSAQHLLKALDAAYLHQVYHPRSSNVYLKLCPALFPTGPLSEMEYFSNEISSLVDSIKIYNSCCGIYWIEYLHSKSDSSLTEESNLKLLINVFKRFMCVVFKKENFKYYENEVEIKKLESAIAAAKLCLRKAPRASEEKELKMEVSKPLQANGYHNGNSSTETGDNASHKVVNGTSNGNSKSSSPELTEDCLNTTDSSETANPAFSRGEHLSHDSSEIPAVQQLKELKMWKKNFENNTCLTPNPFVIYCCIKNILTGLNEGCSNDEVGLLLSDATMLWECVTKS